MLLFAIFQATTDLPAYPLVSLGVGGGIAMLVIGLWRTDRKEAADRHERMSKESTDRYERLAKESGDRYSSLSADFRTIVQDNTKAITALADKIHSSSDGDSVTVRLLVEALKKNKVINVGE